jgi:hypothetical protein
MLDTIKQDEPLYRMIREAVIASANQRTDIDARNQELALRYRDEVLTAFIELRDKLISELSNLANERATVFSDCIRDIQTLRDDIEKKLAELADLANDSKNMPYIVSSSEIERFASLLDEYDLTVNTLVYPHRHNHRVHSVPLSAPTPQILKLDTSKQVSLSDQKRAEVQAAVQKSQSGPSLLRDVQHRAQSISPRGRLAHAFKGIAHNPAPANESLEETLYRLNDDELHSVWNSMIETTVESSSREVMVGTLLAIIGATPSKEQRPVAGINWGLCIGVQDYHNLDPLTKTRQDAQEIHDLLASHGYSRDNLCLLLDNNATKHNIENCNFGSLAAPFHFLPKPPQSV